MSEESAVFKVKMRRWRGEREEAERWRSAIQKQVWVLIGCSGVWADVHVSWYGMVRYWYDPDAQRSTVSVSEVW